VVFHLIIRKGRVLWQKEVKIAEIKYKGRRGYHHHPYREKFSLKSCRIYSPRVSSRVFKILIMEVGVFSSKASYREKRVEGKKGSVGRTRVVYLFYFLI